MWFQITSRYNFLSKITRSDVLERKKPANIQNSILDSSIEFIETHFSC